MSLDLSVFVDEAGSDRLDSTYYLLTLVFHDQKDDLEADLAHYEGALGDKGLPDIPFHAGPLLYGKGSYEGMGSADRRRLFSAFRVFVRHLPIKYWCISLCCSEFDSPTEVETRMRRELIDFFFDNLSYFQSFESVKIYYDNGQQSIAQALHKAIDYALSKDSVIYRSASPRDYRLSQVADYACTLELAALRYRDKRSTKTDEKFFGGWTSFKKGPLKELRAKRFD